MKRFLVFLLAAAMCLALAGCGGKDEENSASGTDYMNAWARALTAPVGDSGIADRVIFVSAEECFCLDAAEDRIDVFIFNISTGSRREVTTLPEDADMWRLFALLVGGVSEGQIAEYGAAQAYFGADVLPDELAINDGYVLMYSRRYPYALHLDISNAVIRPFSIKVTFEDGTEVIGRPTLLEDGRIAIVDILNHSGLCALVTVGGGVQLCQYDSAQLIAVGSGCVLEYAAQCYRFGVGYEEPRWKGPITGCGINPGEALTICNERWAVHHDGGLFGHPYFVLVDREKAAAEIIHWNGSELTRTTAEALETAGDKAPICVLGASGDGRYLAFVSTDGLYMADLETLGVRLIFPRSLTGTSFSYLSGWNGSDLIYSSVWPGDVLNIALDTGDGSAQTEEKPKMFGVEID